MKEKFDINKGYVIIGDKGMEEKTKSELAQEEQVKELLNKFEIKKMLNAKKSTNCNRDRLVYKINKKIIKAKEKGKLNKKYNPKLDRYTTKQLTGIHSHYCELLRK